MELRDEGYDNAQRLDFDFAVMDWWTQFEGMRNERRKTTLSSSDKLGPNQTWAPKYPNDKAILDRLMGVGVGVLDPALEGVSDDDLMDLMGGWDDVDASA